MRFFSLIQVADGSRTAFGDWLIQHFAPNAVAKQPSITELKVNLAIDPPSELQLYGSHETNAGDIYDAVLEVALDTVQEMRDFMERMREETPVRLTVQHDYVVSSRTVLHRPSLEPGLPTPGYKLIRGLFLHEDLPDVAAKRMWQHHETLAVKVHVGLGRYARHWVDERLTPDAPAVRGFSDLHFPDAESLLHRYFDSPRGREEIVHDIAHFIRSGTERVFAREYVF